MQAVIYQKGFKSYLQMERGLLGNKIAAYLHDTDLFFKFLEVKNPELTIAQVSLGHLRNLFSILMISDWDLIPRAGLFQA